MKRFYASLAALTLVVASLLLLNFMNGTSNAALPRDCDNNSIIYCGGITPSELASRYNANKTGDLKTIYHHYGLSDYEMTHAGTSAKMGAVHRDGRVTVNGETVATGATSLGRHQLNSHRTKVKIGNRYYYEGEPKYTYASGVESIVAYVFFDKDGNFKAAVMTSCGNPVHAKPKPKPVYLCNALTADKISRTERKFTASAIAKNGASIVSYTYDFGDGSKKTTSSTTQSHTYKPGTYTAKLTVNIKVNGQTKPVTGPKCQAMITVDTPPPTPEYLCNAITVDKIDRTHFKFSTDYTVSNAVFKKVTYVIRDASGSEIARIDGDTYVQDKPAAYSVQAYVTVEVKGVEKTVTGDDCKQPFTVTPPNKVQVCDQSTGKTITVDEKDKDKYEPVGDAACQPTPVVELPKTGPAETIGSIVGIGSLIASVGYYVASRRGLLAELLGR